jgi:2,4-dienoyl-CoA reductase (NADPH2)
MDATRYAHLFSPIHIGKVRLKNRIVKTAAQTYFFESGECRVGRMATAFYGAVARGGAGLVITETPAMEWPLAETGDRRFRIDDDRYIENLRELSTEVHRYGCPIFTQLYHRGPWGGVYQMLAPRVAASAVTLVSEFDVHEAEPPRALTIGEIDEIVDRYASGAARLAAAGWDGIEINAAADHLFHTFLSRFWNRRDDIYGPQSLENRTRFVVRVIREIKKRAGRDFPVQMLMNAIEIGAGDLGLTIAEGLEIAKVYEAAGVDALHVRSHWAGMHQGSYNQEVLFYPEPHVPLGQFPKELDWSRNGRLAQVPLAALVKNVVSIPVMTVGGFDAALGEAVLREQKADLIGINRRFFADPDYANKVREGRFDDIQPCTYCGNCNKTYGEPRHCRINACFGTESYGVAPVAAKKRVAVVGGGPAGMQAARVAAMRGHVVTLYEKGRCLGGAVPLAAMVKGFEIEDLRDFLAFFRTQMHKLGVDVRLGREFDAAELARTRPDVVVVAAGGNPVLPAIPGIDGRNVIRSTDLYGVLRFWLRLFGPKLLRDLTRVWMPVGRRVVVIGGAIQGCQLAEYLTKRGRKVTIVETGQELGTGLAPERKTRLFCWFDKKGVERIVGATLVDITGRGLRIATGDGQPRLLDADHIMPSLPFAPNRALADRVRQGVPEVFVIGDCDNPGIIPDATAAGWRVGNAI